MTVNPARVEKPPIRGRPRCAVFRALLQPAVADLLPGLVGLLQPLDTQRPLDPGRALELDVRVGDRLEEVAPRVADVNATQARGSRLQAGGPRRGEHRVEVVDHEAEMAAVVR